MKQILVVCWGNIQRSPTAAFLINQELKTRNLEDQYHCISRGIQGSAGIPNPKFRRFSDYEEEFVAAKPIMDEFGIDLSLHESTPITFEDVSEADIIFAMDEKVLRDPQAGLLTQFPDLGQKISLFSSLLHDSKDIQDPYGMTRAEKYRQIIGDIYRITTEGFPTLISLMENNIDTTQETSSEVGFLHDYSKQRRV